MDRPGEDTLLLPFEREHLVSPYRDFLYGKRGACFNTIQAFPDIWNAFEALDRAWAEACKALRVPGTQERILAVLMFLNAHVRVQIAFELGFSRCLSEAGAVLRNAVESAAYAHSFLVKPVAFPQLSIPAAGDQERLRLYKAMRREFKKERSDIIPTQISTRSPSSTLVSLLRARLAFDIRCDVSSTGQQEAALGALFSL